MLPFPSCILLFTRCKISSEKWLGLTDDKNAELCRHTCEFNISHQNIREDWSSKINKRSLSGNTNVADYFPRLAEASYSVCPQDLDPCGLVTLSCGSPKLKQSTQGCTCNTLHGLIGLNAKHPTDGTVWGGGA